MLPADTHVEEVVLGQNGVLDSLRPDTVLVDMSTISPSTVKKIARRLTEKEAYMLDAPVSGGDVAAIDATLSIMVGGNPEIFERVQPIFQKLGRNINYIGENGAGQVTKAANQIIVALTIEAVAEAFIFAKKSGVDPSRVREAIMGGYAQSRILELHGKRMIDRNFKPGGKARSHKKDIEIVLSVARDLDICLPATAFSAHLWNALAAQGGLDLDHSAMVKVLESMSGIKVCAG
jgi:2-hydroxy-3-oxopropionate reductase